MAITWCAICTMCPYVWLIDALSIHLKLCYGYIYLLWTTSSCWWFLQQIPGLYFSLHIAVRRWMLPCNAMHTHKTVQSEWCWVTAADMTQDGMAFTMQKGKTAQLKQMLCLRNYTKLINKWNTHFPSSSFNSYSSLNLVDEDPLAAMFRDQLRISDWQEKIVDGSGIHAISPST